MADFLLLMHGDATIPEDDALWEAYFERLHASGKFRGGSSIGAGAAFRKTGEPGAVSGHLVGYIKVEASNLEAAREWVIGNPVYDAGGTVEVRELPTDS